MEQKDGRTLVWGGQCGQIKASGRDTLCRGGTGKYKGRKGLPVQVSTRGEDSSVHFLGLWHPSALYQLQDLGEVTEMVCTSVSHL